VPVSIWWNIIDTAWDTFIFFATQDLHTIQSVRFPALTSTYPWCNPADRSDPQKVSRLNHSSGFPSRNNQIPQQSAFKMYVAIAHACASKLNCKLVARRFRFWPSTWPSVGSFPLLCWLPSSPSLSVVLFWPGTGFRHGSAESDVVRSIPPKPPPLRKSNFNGLVVFFQDDSLILYSKTSSSYHHLVMLYKNSYLFSFLFFRLFSVNISDRVKKFSEFSHLAVYSLIYTEVKIRFAFNNLLHVAFWNGLVCM